jgi:hypothetical protein
MRIVVSLSIPVEESTPSALAQVFLRLGELAPDAEVRTVSVEGAKPLNPMREHIERTGHWPTAPIPVPDA